MFVSKHLSHVNWYQGPTGTFPASYGFLLLPLFIQKGKFVNGLIFDMKKSLWNQEEEGSVPLWYGFTYVLYLGLNRTVRCLWTEDVTRALTCRG